MPQMDDPFGSYKCLVPGGDDDDDFVLLTAVPGIETKNHQNNVLQGNASFSFDPVLRQIKCCATGSKPPNLRNIYCEDPITCELREVYVMQSGNNGIKFKNSSCTVDRVYYRDSGVFRCKGDGIDVVRHFFSGYGRAEENETSPLYFSWQDADPSKLIDVLQHYRPTSGKIYSNQTIYMSCDASYYYFSEGVHWALKWRNKTVQYLNESFTAYQGSYRRSEVMKTVKLVADMEMESLVCYAPVWNTTDWGSKSHELKIYQSAPPVIVGPVLEEFRYAVNQTNVTIFCMAENGKPNPIIRWRKNNRVVITDSNVIVRRSNGSSSLTFKRVSHDTQGDYKCLVGNVAGKTSKTVRVIIDVSSSSWGAASISITVIVVAALLAGMGLLVWKMKLQKKIIDHLAGVVFRDMSGTQSNQANGR
ncbi:unnamed protein product [Allacma fusca]|uniref:Ig-like domain-containing protein n=1 Tax=Allacma fusca TaxID=39272 RepID=A0A8J2K661_9HEXA|nr:unnamed protein product [Allacma fusca]